VETVQRVAPDAHWRTVADQDGLEGGRNAAMSLLDSGFEPTAIICVNDFMAAGVLRALRDAGLRVPEDVSVTGFDNLSLSEYCWPPLTTAHIPRDEIGELVFRSLAPGLAGGTPPARETLFEPELVIRASTGPAPHAR
jgi:DNA-binding LacI/PurR family transcriptional regulator